MMKKLLWMSFLALTASTSSAATYCNGKVNAVYKWNSMTTLSMQIVTNDGTTTPWINLPTKSDEAMALLAFSTGKPVVLYWHAADVSACLNGWEHNKVLNGYFVVSN